MKIFMIVLSILPSLLFAKDGLDFTACYSNDDVVIIRNFVSKPNDIKTYEVDTVRQGVIEKMNCRPGEGAVHMVCDHKIENHPNPSAKHSLIIYKKLKGTIVGVYSDWFESPLSFEIPVVCN